MAKFMIVNKHFTTPGTAALVTILDAPLADESGNPVLSPAPFAAQITFHEGCGLHLLAARCIAVNAAVKIEAGHAIWLGTVESCDIADPNEDASGPKPDPADEGEKTWRIVVHVSRVLRDVDTLKRLAGLFESGKISNSTLFRSLTAQI